MEIIESKARKVLHIYIKGSIQLELSGNNAEDTPVPIPNTEVKLRSADDTWWVTARESRSLLR